VNGVQKFLASLAATLVELGVDLDNGHLSGHEIVGLIVSGIGTAAVYALTNRPTPPTA
jgi:hypothetical protein